MRRRKSLILICGALAVLTGCGAATSSSTASTSPKDTGNESTATPATEFSDAYQRLMSESTVTTTLSLVTSGENLASISRQDGSSGLSDQQASQIATAQIVFETKAAPGKSVSDTNLSDDGGALQITGLSEGRTYFTVDVVGKTLYVQADVKGLYEAEGDGDQEGYDGLVENTKSAPDFVKDLIAGKAVSVPLSTIENLQSFAEGFEHSAGGDGFPTEAQINALRPKLIAAIIKDVTVTRTGTGSTDELDIAANLRTLAEDALPVIATAFPQLPAPEFSQVAGTVPNLNLSADAFVTGGELSKVSFDLGQFDPSEHVSIPLQAAFEPSGADITAPTDATPVDLSRLTSLLRTATSTSGGSSTSRAGTPMLASPQPTTKAPH